MRMIDIIAKKRDNLRLNEAEIEYIVSGAVDGSIPDYQLSSLLMAICINGMSETETANLTTAMAQSGRPLDLSVLGEKTVDKHSTGGVGDKTTLICAPIAAALGCTVAKMSGRGLGHTGGTIDKLESITGYKTALSHQDFLDTASKHGICLIGQSGNLAPADKRLYALRDVTATVESIPLIASSIMSKKIAAGAKNIILDVKCGSGAFMKTPEQARKLALEMVKTGKNIGRNTSAFITDMEIPLGYAVGNALEVKEAVEVLNGNGEKRLTELCIALSAEMYRLCFGGDFETAKEKARGAIADGSAFKKLCEAVGAMSGDTRLLTGEKAFAKPEAECYITAETEGYITKLDSLIVGKAASISGAGREFLGQDIDFSAGVILLKKYGEYVKRGEKIALIQGKEEKLASAAEVLKKAYEFGEQKPQERKLIYERIE